MNLFSNTHGTQSPEAQAPEYKALGVEPCHEPPRPPLPGARKGRGGDGAGKSAGGDSASAVGCNANNGNGSVRTANCNNALSNGNDNYAGAFAMTNGDTLSGEPSTTRPARPNNCDNPAATGGQGRCEYGPLPFMGGGSAESNATATVTGSDDIFTELRAANRRRKLKHMEKFFEDPEIVGMAIDRALSKAANTAEVRKAKGERDAIRDRIIREFKTRTYRMGKIEHRPIKPKSPDGKWREGDIYPVYDRCVLNVPLIVLRTKLENLLTRHVYSGIPTRSLFSNTKEYCMVSQLSHYVATHPDDLVGLTDIRHFYENMRSEVALGVLFRVIVCPFTRWLLCETLLALPYVAIGGTLSQIVAMVTLSEMDREILSRFHPRFYGAFGDNRVFGGDRETVLAIKSFEESYLAGRYGLPLKGDYSFHRVGDGFRFCRYDFKDRSVHIRAALRRRAIRAAKRGKQHYAGHKGILDKTDSGALKYLIEHNMESLVTKGGVTLKPMAGEVENKKDNLVGHRLIVLDYRKVPNGKDSGYFLRIQALDVTEKEVTDIVDGEEVRKKVKATRLIVFKDGSYEIKDFFRCVEEGTEKLPCDTYFARDGNSFYFTCHHVTNKEACETIISELENLGITI